MKKLVDVNADVLEGRTLGQVEELWFESKDGLKVQGWLVKPVEFEPGKKYPMVLWIHGGPWSMYDVGFNWGFQNFAAQGYAVLYTNPRGSTGYGQDFVNGIQYSYPGKDYDDLMAGVDAAIAKGFIDEKNLFVCGGSGGGVLTAWIVGHTNRFAAAVSMRPVINWHSFVGTTDGPSLVPAVPEVPVGRPDGIRRALAAALRGQRHHADHGDDRRGRSADADPAERGVLPRAEDAEEGHAARADARRVSTAGAARRTNCCSSSTCRRGSRSTSGRPWPTGQAVTPRAEGVTSCKMLEGKTRPLLHFLRTQHGPGIIADARPVVRCRRP